MDTKGKLSDRVERQLAAKFGWDLELFHGKPFRIAGLDISYGVEYEVLNGEAFFLPGKSRIEYLRLTEWLTFGNAVEQLHNLFLTAETYGIRHIVCPEHPFFRGGRIEDFDLLGESERHDTAAGVGIAGVFYHLEPFGIRPPAEGLLRRVQRYVRPLLSNDLMCPDPRVGETDLVLHFRAGDVFAPKRPVAHYGQPPLAYYLAAVERENPKRVWLVFEDRRNPCIDAVEALLNARGTNVVIQSGSLAEDLRVLLSARRLVIGPGTLTIGVAMLSSQLRRVYTFKGSEAWDYPRLPDVEMIQGLDLTGEYVSSVMSLNWTGAPEQKALMLSYPITAIGFDV